MASFGSRAWASAVFGGGAFGVSAPPAGGSADHLTVVTQPSGGTSTVVFATQPVVQVRDSGEAVVSSSTAAVVATLNVVTGSGTLSGTTTKNAVSGVATFTDLKVTGSGTFTITFTSAGLPSPSTTSSTFSISGLTPSPYLNLATDGKDIGVDASIVYDLTATAISGDRRGVTENRAGGTGSSWYSWGGIQRVQLPRVLLNTDMPSWAALQAMTPHSINSDAGLSALLSGGSLATGGHVVILDNTVIYGGNYYRAFPLRSTGDATPGPTNTNIVIFISKAIWDSMVANSGVATVCPEKRRVTSGDLSSLAFFRGSDTLSSFVVDGATKGWRFVGLRFGMTSGTTQVSHLVGMGNSDGAIQSNVSMCPSNIGLDRCWIDGTATCNTRHGVELACINGYVIDCGFGDFIHVDAGFSESHAMCGLNGPGPFRIVNNRIVGGSQSLLLGGGILSCGMIADVEFRWNYMTRPDSWNPNHPSYDGVFRQVKCNFEIKKARYVLAEGNVNENIWPAAQAGSAWLLKSESYGDGATIGYTSDILVRWNLTRNAAFGPNIAGVPNTDAAFPPARVWYVGNLQKLGGNYSNSNANPHVGLGINSDCGIVHNTFYTETTTNMGVSFPSSNGACPNIVVQDNIWGNVGYGWKVDSRPLTDLPLITPGGTLNNNVIVHNGGSGYPSGNFVINDQSTILWNPDFSLQGTAQGSGGGGPTPVVSSIVFTTQPGNGNSGTALPTQPVVEFRDQFGAPISSTLTVNLAVATGGATITAGGSKTAVGGVAAFSGLTLTAPTTASVTLTASASGVPDITSASFTLTVVQTATKLGLQTPPTGIITGQVFQQQPVVLVQDASSVTVSSSSASVSVAVTSGTAVLSGTTTKAAVNGVVNFTDLKLTGTGTVVLTFTSAGLTSVSTATLTVNPVPTGNPKTLPHRLPAQSVSKSGATLDSLWFL